MNTVCKFSFKGDVMVSNLSSRWLAQQSAQQAELTEIGVELAKLGMEGLSRVNHLNFKTAKNLLAHTGNSFASITLSDQSQSTIFKAAEQALAEVQCYVREAADLAGDMQQQANALFEVQLGLVKASAETLIDEARKVSPGTSEIVGGTLRGWMDGTQSAFEQINQISVQLNKITGNNTALIGAWQAGHKAPKARTSSKALA